MGSVDSNVQHERITSSLFHVARNVKYRKIAFRCVPLNPLERSYEWCDPVTGNPTAGCEFDKDYSVRLGRSATGRLHILCLDHFV